VFTIGIGFRKGTTQETIELAIRQVFQDFHLLDSRKILADVEVINPKLIACIASIDKKATEASLIQLCHSYSIPLKTFTAELLNSVDVPNPSQITKNKVGSLSVAEAAAILAANLLTEVVEHGILVPKQIYSTVTIAVVQIQDKKSAFFRHPH
jgi:cobalt-precorrin 5A hydrolase